MSSTVRGIRCPECGESIWSRHRHDMRWCSCGYCAIDGGREYIKVSFSGDKVPMDVMVETIPEDTNE